jgi:hypothetical protein
MNPGSEAAGMRFQHSGCPSVNVNVVAAFPLGPAAADPENYRGCGMLLTEPTCKVQYLYRQLWHQLRFYGE